MDTFNPDFYPTPPEVVRKMIEPYADRLRKATILEPSAGSGAILDILVKEGVEKEYNVNGHVCSDTVWADPKRVYSIESDPDLRLKLHEKGYRVIATDFLAFRPEHRFDLVVMNPPFRNGDDHLLHAWDILPGGDIACLLNAETLLNPYTAARKRLAAIIAENGSSEILGPVFKDALRTTDVEVALVRLHKKPAEDPFRVDVGGFARENAPDFGALAGETDTVMVSNKLDAYIRCWDLTKAAALEFIRSFARFRFFVNAFLPDDQRGDNAVEHILKSLKDIRYSHDSMADVYNRFLDTTKASAWNTIIQQIGFGKYMTSGLRQTLDEFRTAQGAMEISKENINTLFLFVMQNIGTIMDKSVVEVYDLFTRFYDGNTSCDEGWKTNKRFRCNRKVILPNAADAGYKPQVFGYNEYFSPHYDARLSDIDKAMCWLSGRNYDSMDSRIFDVCNHYRECMPDKASIETALRCIRVGDQDWHESAFFRIRAFKKGTVHLEFKDEDLWNKFNITVNEGKNQLGMAE